MIPSSGIASAGHLMAGMYVCVRKRGPMHINPNRWSVYPANQPICSSLSHTHNPPQRRRAARDSVLLRGARPALHHGALYHGTQRH